MFHPFSNPLNLLSRHSSPSFVEKKMMVQKVSLLLTTLVFMAAACQKEPIVSAEKVSSKVEVILQKVDFEGVVLIARKNEILFEKAYGLANREKNILNSINTVFDIGSVTKVFTAMAILKLYEQGKLTLTDELSKHFEHVPADKLDITIAQLLTHSSGLPSTEEEDYEPITKMPFLQRAFSKPLLFKPGSAYEYSNIGFSLLGMIIEQVSGLTYEHYLKQTIFDPAGMTQTGYRLPNWVSDQIAIGYFGIAEATENFSMLGKMFNLGDPLGKPNELPWDVDGPYWNLKANGGLLSTAVDLYKLHQALQNGRILSKATLDLMYAKYLPEEKNGETFRGYGWLVADTDLGKLVAHNGSNAVFYSDYWRLLEDNTVLILLTNCLKSESYLELNQKMAEAMFE